MENNVSYSYDVLVTDACGNTYLLNNNSISFGLQVEINTGIAGCSDNFAELIVLYNGTGYNVNFINFPAGFNPLLFNSNYPGPYTGPIFFGGLGNSLPAGNYTVEVVDSCGNTGQYSFTINPSQATTVEEITTPSGCGTNAGSISLFFNPIKEISSVILTAAPFSYSNPIPQNVSQFIGSNNVFLFENLPVGIYTFTLVDTCGNTYTHSATVDGISGNIGIGNRPGCTLGMTSILITVQNSNITFVEILEAPSTFSFSFYLMIFLQI